MSNLKKMREAAGMSQSKLAEKSNVKLRMIQVYEQGYRDIDGANLETLLDLASALGCKVADILENPIMKEKANNAL